MAVSVVKPSAIVNILPVPLQPYQWQAASMVAANTTSMAKLAKHFTIKQN